VIVNCNSQPQLLPAETLSMIWFNLHADERFAVRANEAHYLRMLAVALDDDLASLLLLKKLKLADEYGYGHLPPDRVALNSFVEFRIELEPSRVCQLLHPSPRRPEFSIGVESRLGLGLLGLRTGQSILWPDEQERMLEIEVLRVENCPDGADWLQVGRLQS
jgi:regulator of nucleoside diphosphate kinase